jgi:beta-fructofuranosidase
VKHKTDEARYRCYNEYSAEYLSDIERQTAESNFLPRCHIRPQSGLLNDPNGFSYYNGKWRLFYQAFPFGAAHGLKSWGYLTSRDLVRWKYEGLAILPDTPFDSCGAYSGSAIEAGKALNIFYTGNAMNENGKRLSCQMRAVMDESGKITKDAAPVIAGPPRGYTMNFRDPQIFRCAKGYRMILGAQTESGQGRILVYRSADIKKWEHMGELCFTKRQTAYMIECPNLVFAGGKPVLIFCPQGLDRSLSPYANIYPNKILVGRGYDEASNTILSNGAPENLDDGFEFYAAQAMTAPGGRVLLVAWVGLPDTATPTETENWAHCLSLVRELTLKDGKPVQYPVRETQSLRGERSDFCGSAFSCVTRQNCYEMELCIPAHARGEIVFADAVSVAFDSGGGTIAVTRAKDVRETRVRGGRDMVLNLFVDRSVFELFANKGEKSLTGRFFPCGGNTTVALSANAVLTGSLWEINL